MQFYVAVLFGGVLFILFQLNGVLNNPDFSWKFFFKNNIIPLLINLFVGWAFVFMRDDMEAFYPITLFSAFILGISGQAIFKKLQNAFDKKLNTKLGL